MRFASGAPRPASEDPYSQQKMRSLQRVTAFSSDSDAAAKTDSCSWADRCDIQPQPILAYCRLLQAIVVHDSRTC